MKTVTDFLFLSSKITENGDCSHEIKRCFLLGRKAMINLDSILKSRVITLPTKVHVVKAMVSPIVMYGCESGTIKKAEGRRIDAFKLWCWRKLLNPGPLHWKCGVLDTGSLGKSHVYVFPIKNFYLFIFV